MEFDLFQPEACPAGHVFNIPGVKRRRREEALARFEVAASQQKPKLIGGRAQVRGGLLDCLGEIKILLALETVKHRGRLKGFLLDGVENIHSRHGGPPDKVVPEPEWPERARIQHVRVYKEPWHVSPNVTGAAVSTFSVGTEQDYAIGRTITGRSPCGPAGPETNLNRKEMAWHWRGFSMGLYVPLLEFNLGQKQNRYLVRQLCWVLTVEGLDTYLLRPRD